MMTWIGEGNFTTNNQHTNIMLTTTIVLQGQSGTGKTDKTLTLGLYDHYLGIIDMDGKAIDNVKSFHSRTGLKPKVKVKYPNLAKDKTPIPAGSDKAWLRVKEIVKEFIEDPEVKWISLDSMNFLMELCKDHLIAKGGVLVAGFKTMERALWDVLRAEFFKVLVDIKASGKGLIMILHDQEDTDVMGQKFIGNDLQGKLSGLPAKLTTEHWHCITKLDPTTKKTKYLVRLRPDGMGKWKTAFTTLPDEWEFNIPELQAAIEAHSNDEGMENVVVG